MHVCIYVCMCVFMYVCMCVFMYVCLHACVYICMYVRPSVRPSVRTYVCMYVHMYISIYLFSNARVASGRHQLPAEDGAGEDRLPAVRLPDRPVAVERVQGGDHGARIQRQVVAAQVIAPLQKTVVKRRF